MLVQVGERYINLDQIKKVEFDKIPSGAIYRIRIFTDNAQTHDIELGNGPDIQAFLDILALANAYTFKKLNLNS